MLYEGVVDDLFSPHRASAHRLRRYRTSTPAPVAWYGGTASLSTAAFMLIYGMVCLHCLTTCRTLSCRSSSLFHNFATRPLCSGLATLPTRNDSRHGILYQSLRKPLSAPSAPVYYQLHLLFAAVKLTVVRLGFIRQLIQPALPKSIRFSLRMIEVVPTPPNASYCVLPIASRMIYVCQSGDFLIEPGKRLRCRLAQPGELIDIRRPFSQPARLRLSTISAASFSPTLTCRRFPTAATKIRGEAVYRFTSSPRRAFCPCPAASQPFYNAESSFYRCPTTRRGISIHRLFGSNAPPFIAPELFAAEPGQVKRACDAPRIVADVGISTEQTRPGLIGHVQIRLTHTPRQRWHCPSPAYFYHFTIRYPPRSADTGEATADSRQFIHCRASRCSLSSAAEAPLVHCA